VDAHRKRKQPRWVWAVAAGAALLGAGLVYFSATAEDTQRIEIHWP
jgi:uncharacterized membrane protein HdeD (DUF308 family)